MRESSDSDPSKWEAVAVSISPASHPPEPDKSLRDHSPEGADAACHANTLHVQWSLLLTQRDLLLDEIKRHQRQLTQVQTTLADYETRFAQVNRAIQIFERQSHYPPGAGDEPPEFIYTVLRGAN